MFVKSELWQSFQYIWSVDTYVSIELRSNYAVHTKMYRHHFPPIGTHRMPITRSLTLPWFPPPPPPDFPPPPPLPPPAVFFLLHLPLPVPLSNFRLFPFITIFHLSITTLSTDLHTFLLRDFYPIGRNKDLNQDLLIELLLEILINLTIWIILLTAFDDRPPECKPPSPIQKIPIFGHFVHRTTTFKTCTEDSLKLFRYNIIHAIGTTCHLLYTNIL